MARKFAEHGKKYQAPRATSLSKFQVAKVRTWCPALHMCDVALQDKLCLIPQFSNFSLPPHPLLLTASLHENVPQNLFLTLHKALKYKYLCGYSQDPQANIRVRRLGHVKLKEKTTLLGMPYDKIQVEESKKEGAEGIIKERSERYIIRAWRRKTQNRKDLAEIGRRTWSSMFRDARESERERETYRQTHTDRNRKIQVEERANEDII